MFLSQISSMALGQLGFQVYFIKGVFKFALLTLFLSFVIGYTVGNYHATKASLNYPGYYSFGNFVGWFVLKSAGDKEVEKLKKIDYNNLPK